MLGRKDYTQEELDAGKAAIAAQLDGYRKLEAAARAGKDGAKVAAALESFETPFFNTLVLALDRYYVHRLAGPKYEGKDGNPLNEVRIVADSLMNNGGVMRDDKQITLSPDHSVLKLGVGDKIELTEDDFERLSGAFFSELERRFV